ncbi:MAG: hypothetical protein ABR981_03420 [Candidatus Micrarchaeaceae archaeon]|jgi:hypothetical protein
MVLKEHATKTAALPGLRLSPVNEYRMSISIGSFYYRKEVSFTSIASNDNAFRIFIDAANFAAKHEWKKKTTRAARKAYDAAFKNGLICRELGLFIRASAYFNQAKGVSEKYLGNRLNEQANFASEDSTLSYAAKLALTNMRREEGEARMAEAFRANV